MNSHVLMALGRHDGGSLIENADEALTKIVRDVVRYGGKGKLTVHFYSDEQLRAFANLLGQYQMETE